MAKRSDFESKWNEKFPDFEPPNLSVFEQNSEVKNFLDVTRAKVEELRGELERELFILNHVESIYKTKSTNQRSSKIVEEEAEGRGDFSVVEFQRDKKTKTTQSGSKKPLKRSAHTYENVDQVDSKNMGQRQQQKDDSQSVTPSQVIQEVYEPVSPKTAEIQERVSYTLEKQANSPGPNISPSLKSPENKKDVECSSPTVVRRRLPAIPPQTAPKPKINKKARESLGVFFPSTKPKENDESPYSSIVINSEQTPELAQNKENTPKCSNDGLKPPASESSTCKRHSERTSNALGRLDQLIAGQEYSQVHKTTEGKDKHVMKINEPDIKIENDDDDIPTVPVKSPGLQDDIKNANIEMLNNSLYSDDSEFSLSPVSPENLQHQPQNTGKDTDPYYSAVCTDDDTILVDTLKESDSGSLLYASVVNENTDDTDEIITSIDNIGEDDSGMENIYDTIDENIITKRLSCHYGSNDKLDLPMTTHQRLSESLESDLDDDERLDSIDSTTARISQISENSVFHFDSPQSSPGTIRKSIDGTECIPEDSETNGDVEWSEADLEKLRMRKWVVTGILDSENIYIDCLSILDQYMKNLEAAARTTKPMISEEEISIIFHKIPELFKSHKAFVEDLEPRVENWSDSQKVGEVFKVAAVYLKQVYGDYLKNYQKALSTMKKCCQENQEFQNLIKEIKLKGVAESASLEELLHKPVVRVQRNTLVLHDLIRCTPTNHPDHMVLQKALKLTQYFLENLEDPMELEKNDAVSYLVKDSFIVEQTQGHRKLRHVFLFNDVIVCTKQKSTGGKKYNADCKWYIALSEVTVLENKTDEVIEKLPSDSKKTDIETLKANVSQLKKELRREARRHNGSEKDRSSPRSWSFSTKGNIRNIEKIRKKLAEQEAMLVLMSPNLMFKLHHKAQDKTYTFLMSSNYERDEWKESIKALQAKVHTTPKFTSYELQTLVNSISKVPKINNAGSFLMKDGNRSFEANMDEELLSGVLNITIHSLHGLKEPCDTYCCIEVDSFGHFFMQAKTNMFYKTTEPAWNEEYCVDLDGAQTLRVMAYKQEGEEQILLGKIAMELGKAWLRGDFVEKTMAMSTDLSMTITLRYTPSTQTIKRVASRVKTGVFGVKIQTVTKRENNNIPAIVLSCVQEVEKSGLKELGIYRVSGSSSDVQQLKKAFDRNSKGAAKLVTEFDINAITGVLKLYFRELPEALFTDKLYPSLVKGMELADPAAKRECMVTLLRSLPEPNFATAVYMIDHLVMVSKLASVNKMSLQNLATIFGPTLLRPASEPQKDEGGDESSNIILQLTREAKDSMIQTAILMYYLWIRNEGVSFDAPKTP
ncbi:unnamed protein product, partial [Owenia fusiformis]